eukprot:TRINITY_DN8788_c0_g2_i1.p1 TRINITY_DN8788_c0_g2~~TRINITY_DN8788_c0_g2_i1.p1  ORF type:complete len:358 (+),score=65.92 TRINITY_DN8788_c0_g2_i1:43-1074(+)
MPASRSPLFLLAVLASAMFVSLLFFVCVDGARIPIIIDTDIGQDMDDSWAVSAALKSPEVDVRMILTAAHNAKGRAQIVAKFLQTVGRTDIPIGVGVVQDDFVGPLYGWAQDYDLATYPGKLYANGVQAALDIINNSSETITMVAIAPMGNFEAMLQAQPSVSTKVKIAAMSGSVYKCYGNSPGACAEYNVKENIQASQAVYSKSTSWPMTITPLDTCGIVVLNGTLYQTLLKGNSSTNTILQTLLENYQYWSEHGGSGHPATSSTTLYDTVAFYLSFSDLSFCVMQNIPLIVDNTGVMRINSTAGKEVDVAVNWTPASSSSTAQTGLVQYTSWLVQRLLTIA